MLYCSCIIKMEKENRRRVTDPLWHVSSVGVVVMILQNQDGSDDRQTHNHHGGCKVLRWKTEDKVFVSNGHLVLLSLYAWDNRVKDILLISVSPLKVCKTEEKSSCLCWLFIIAATHISWNWLNHTGPVVWNMPCMSMLGGRWVVLAQKHPED